MKHTLTFLTALLLTPLAALQAADQPLESGFINPSPEARPMVWWHWMDGNITKQGITLDLEAMKRVGIGGASIFTLGPIVAPPVTGLPKVEYQSREWVEAMHHAAREARRLDLDLGTMPCAGWATSGGTWVKPAQAMRKLVWSETSFTGPGRFTGCLALPPDNYGPFQDLEMAHGQDPRRDARHYEDTVVVACRQPEGAWRMADAKPVITSSGEIKDLSAICDGRLASRVTIPKAGGTAWVRFDFPQPFACQGVVSWVGLPRGAEAVLEASDDGTTFRPLGSVLQWSSERPAQDGALPRYSYAKPATSRHFRITVANLKADWLIGELVLNGEAWLNSWPRSWTTATNPLPADDRPAGISFDDVIDLTGRLKPDGSLDWEAPPGRWVVLRFGHSPTGHTNNRPPPLAEGLECDKLSRPAVLAYFDGFLGPLAGNSGTLAQLGFRHLLMDSWECKDQSWTPAMREEFRRRRGYDPAPWMPVLSGRVVGSVARSERFLCDFRRTIGDLLVENYFALAQETARRQGLTYMSEAPGLCGATVDAMRCKGVIDVPMAEFWSRPVKDNQRCVMDCRDAASGAHVHGKRIAAAEAFTDGSGKIWRSHPFQLKTLGDYFFCQGINRFVFHSYPHQPFTDQRPGMSMWTIGTFLGRTDTWWENGGKAWFSYLSRCQFLLQQGLPAADVAILISDIVPASAIATPGIDKVVKALPAGLDYDLINGEALLVRASVRDGRLVLPDGVAYRLLVLPEQTLLTPAVAARLRDLVVAGLTVAGPRPASTPTLSDHPRCDQELARIVDEVWADCDGKTVTQRTCGKGQVFNGLPIPKVLAAIGLAPDVAWPADGEVAFVHRRVGDSQIYFVSNQRSDRTVEIPFSFRVVGLQPELWDPSDGCRRDAAAFRIADGRTIVPLVLEPAGSRFVIFRRPITATAGSAERNEPVLATVATIAGPWTVAFAPALGGPPASTTFAELSDWSKHAEPGIRHYAGTAVYRADLAITADRLTSGRPLYLDLGAVEVVAEVALNGKALGTLWKPPFRVDIASAAKAGTNQLEVRITSQWHNRLVGDAGLPEDQRITKVSYPNPYKKGTALLPAGLLGPVTLQTVGGGETP